ncbi:MAG TPA: TlpA disulfide reductase family protein [Caulobacteraceae bacterium]|jgi:peroxiredoxin|nr:TlpA disulfide reductase family protein [Caulobacteraceae bacterium]
MRTAIVIAAACVWLLAGGVARAETLKVGQPAPDFQVETFDGHHMRLSDFRGQVVILNFWATWCAPCRKELPTLDTYYRLRKDAGLVVLAVATEDSVPESFLRPLAKVVAFPMVRRMHGPYRIMNAVPTNFVIDRNGVLRYAKPGAFDLDRLNAVLAPLLSDPPPAADAGPGHAP